MIAIPPTGKPPTRKYARLLQKLHTLLREGNGDSAAADAVRDEMDAPWYAMTEMERNRLGVLSEDLYGLGSGHTEPVRLTSAEREQWVKDSGEALGARDWDRLLELLRQAPEDLPADGIRLAQARCWEHLGEREVALLFRREAGRLNPETANGGSLDPWKTILNVPV